MKFSNLKLVTFFTALFFITFDCFSDIIEDETAVEFAGFIQDLVHTTQTPKRGPICGIGSDEVSKVIAAQDKTFIDLDLEPKKYEQCKAVYIAQGREKSLRVEIEKLNKKKINSTKLNRMNLNRIKLRTEDVLQLIKIRFNSLLFVQSKQ